MNACSLCSRNLLSLMGLIVFVILATGTGDTGESQSAPAPRVDTTLSPLVSADELFAAYEQNEIRADQTYKGHYIEVYGHVSHVGKDLLDNAFLTFRARHQLLSVQCLLSKPIPRWVGDVTPGVYLSLICKVNGKFGNILLEDCRAGSMGPPIPNHCCPKQAGIERRSAASKGFGISER